MTDERFYCPIHRRPVEYVPELGLTGLYVCGLCEELRPKEEVIPARLLEPSIESIMAEIEKGMETRDVS